MILSFAESVGAVWLLELVFFGLRFARSLYVMSDIWTDFQFEYQICNGSRGTF